MSTFVDWIFQKLAPITSVIIFQIQTIEHLRLQNVELQLCNGFINASCRNCFYQVWWHTGHTARWNYSFAAWHEAMASFYVEVFSRVCVLVSKLRSVSNRSNRRLFQNDWTAGLHVRFLSIFTKLVILMNLNYWRLRVLLCECQMANVLHHWTLSVRFFLGFILLGALNTCMKICCL